MNDDEPQQAQRKPLECHQCKSTAGAREYELVEPRGPGMEPYRVCAILCAVHAVEHEEHFKQLRAKKRQQPTTEAP